MEKERLEKRTVLFPIGLDESAMETGQAWAALFRRTQHIDDLGHWKDHDACRKAFARLLRGLEVVEEAKAGA